MVNMYCADISEMVSGSFMVGSVYLGYLHCVEVFETITRTLVKSNVIQHNSSAITITIIVKLITFNIC